MWLDHVRSLCEEFDELDDSKKIGVVTSHTNIVRKTAYYLYHMLKLRGSHLTV